MQGTCGQLSPMAASRRRRPVGNDCPGVLLARDATRDNEACRPRQSRGFFALSADDCECNYAPLSHLVWVVELNRHSHGDYLGNDAWQRNNFWSSPTFRLYRLVFSPRSIA